MTKLCPRGKAAAKRKFKVYPSAYANAYASKICAGKIKDPSGVKRKDFKGPKPAKEGMMTEIEKEATKRKAENRLGSVKDRMSDKEDRFTVSDLKKIKKKSLGGMLDGHSVAGSSVQGDYGVNPSAIGYYKDLLK